MPPLCRITIYPIKSFDGVDLNSAKVQPSGVLAGDRRYALIDSEGRFVNAKRFPVLQRIRSEYDEAGQRVTVALEGASASFDLVGQRVEFAKWCGDALEVDCRLIEDEDAGFPDDQKRPGPTIISNATLREIASWFPQFDLDETRRRFRANLELDCELPFWEDQLVGPTESSRCFCIGATRWQGNGVCQRCAVPSRDSREATVTSRFAQHFSQRREESLPNWSPRERFDHFYRVAINTTLISMDNGDVIRLGDPVELIEDASLGH